MSKKKSDVIGACMQDVCLKPWCRLCDRWFSKHISVYLLNHCIISWLQSNLRGAETQLATCPLIPMPMIHASHISYSQQNSLPLCFGTHENFPSIPTVIIHNSVVIYFQRLRMFSRAKFCYLIFKWHKFWQSVAGTCAINTHCISNITGLSMK